MPSDEEIAAASVGKIEGQLELIISQMGSFASQKSVDEIQALLKTFPAQYASQDTVSAAKKSTDDRFDRVNIKIDEAKAETKTLSTRLWGGLSASVVLAGGALIKVFMGDS
jgi:hypothetical protein